MSTNVRLIIQGRQQDNILNPDIGPGRPLLDHKNIFSKILSTFFFSNEIIEYSGRLSNLRNKESKMFPTFLHWCGYASSIPKNVRSWGAGVSVGMTPHAPTPAQRQSNMRVFTATSWLGLIFSSRIPFFLEHLNRHQLPYFRPQHLNS